MAEILTRHVDERTKHIHAMMAASLGITLNDWCVHLFEETALPLEEVHGVILERMEQLVSSGGRKEFLLSMLERVDDARQHKLTIRKYDSVPSPRTPTRPFEGE